MVTTAKTEKAPSPPPKAPKKKTAAGAGTQTAASATPTTTAPDGAWPLLSSAHPGHHDPKAYDVGVCFGSMLPTTGTPPTTELETSAAAASGCDEIWRKLGVAPSVADAGASSPSFLCRRRRRIPQIDAVGLDWRMRHGMAGGDVIAYISVQLRKFIQSSELYSTTECQNFTKFLSAFAELLGDEELEADYSGLADIAARCMASEDLLYTHAYIHIPVCVRKKMCRPHLLQMFRCFGIVHGRYSSDVSTRTSATYV